MTADSAHQPLSKLPNFDPRAIPVRAVDAHLPAVPLHNLQPPMLRQRFLHAPHWTPEFTVELSFSNRAPMHASVLIPIITREQPTVLLTQRASHLATHSGQVAFPGGKADDGDIDAAHTALREAQEEVGLDGRFVRVLGQLPTYVTGSAFVITPVVALVQPGFSLQPNPHEVDAVFEVPLRFLMDPANHRHHWLDWQGVRREWLSMPYQDGADERFIWGATAGMLRNLYRFLSA